MPDHFRLTLRWRSVALLAVTLASLAACAPADGRGREGDSGITRAPGDAAREMAIAIDRLRPQLARKEWKNTLGNASATLSGFSAGDTLKLVREVISYGAAGRDATRYYFAGSQLRYFELEGERAETAAAQDPSKPATKHKHRLVLAFDEQGGAVESSYLVDGAIAPLDSTRIQGAVARAAEVARQWATLPPASR